MSQISDIYDALHTAVATVLPNHAQLINPYFLESDSQISLAAAYGIKMNQGINLLGNENSFQEQRSRDFALVLTRRKFATKANITERKSVEKQLFEDLTLVLDEIAKRPKLGLAAIQRTLYISDTGVQFLPLGGDRVDIYFLEATLTVEYENEVYP